MTLGHAGTVLHQCHRRLAASPHEMLREVPAEKNLDQALQLGSELPTILCHAGILRIAPEPTKVPSIGRIPPKLK